jgi:hypothetical protein
MPTTYRQSHLLAIVAAISAALLFTTPVFAWGNEHPTDARGDKDDRVTHAENREDQDHDLDAAMMRTMMLVNAINNEVTRLSNMDIDNPDLDDMVKSISLSKLETGLTPDEATSVTNAVNANTAALQAFLANGTDEAAAIDGALSDLGIARSSALAILPGRHHRFLVITS